jgi:hypothetical protein
MAKRAWFFNRRAQWTLFFAVVALTWVAVQVTGSRLVVAAIPVAGSIVAYVLLRKYPPP